MCANETLALGIVHHLFLAAAHVHHLLLLHHRQVSLRLRSGDGIRAGEILSLYVVNAVGHDDRGFGVALLVHFSVSN